MKRTNSTTNGQFVKMYTMAIQWCTVIRMLMRGAVLFLLLLIVCQDIAFYWRPIPGWTQASSFLHYQPVNIYLCSFEWCCYSHSWRNWNGMIFFLLLTACMRVHQDVYMLFYLLVERDDDALAHLEKIRTCSELPSNTCSSMHFATCIIHEYTRQLNAAWLHFLFHILSPRIK